MAFKDLFSRKAPNTPSTSDGRLNKEIWDQLTPEMRAILPWNVVGDDDYGVKTNSGASVNEDTAMKMGVVFAAVTLISDGIASLPPLVYSQSEDGNRVTLPVPQWIRKPHPEIRRFDIFSQLLVSTLLWGNGFAQLIRRPSDGVVVGLQPLDPALVQVEWDPNKAGYRRYRLNGGAWLTSYDIFHIQGPTLPGDATGMSVIKYAREAIGLGLTLEEYGSRYFGQGSQAKVVLELPQKVPDVAAARDIIGTFERFHKGKNNWHRPAIVSGGAKLHTISISPDDAQFLQSRDFQAVEIARWFRVPPHRVGIVSKSTSWGSGLAEENMAMLQHTYRPWIIRLQDALTAYAPGGMDSGTLVELDTAALLQGTFKELADIWTGLYEKDIANKNEARQRLGLPKVDSGDKFFSETTTEQAKDLAQSAPAPMAPNNADSPGNGGRTNEEDKLRKQEEAKRALLEDPLEFRINTNHDRLGQFASRPGMSAATPEKKAEFKEKVGKSIPPAWTDVQIADDLDTASLQVVGRDAKGRRQAWYSKAHTRAQAEKKFTRIKALSEHTDKLDSTLERDRLVNDEAGALTLIRHLGMRPGSNANRGADVQAHGATNIKAKHVKFENDGATLDFTGKDGVHIVLHTKDKRVVETLQSRHIGKGDDDQLFNTNEDKVRDYMRGEAGVPKEFLLKDLRTMHANTAAMQIISSMPKPTTKAEFTKQRNEVGRQVAAQLGNDATMALGSYINPTVFGSWAQEGWLK